MEKMTSKNKTLSKIEELRIAFLIVHDFDEFLICIEDTFSKCEQLVMIIVEVNNSLHESVAFIIKIEGCSKWWMLGDNELKCMLKSFDW